MMTSLKLKAVVDQIEAAIKPIIDALEGLQVDHKTCYKIRLALDELLTNVVDYAYGDKEGNMEIRYEINENPRSITIMIIDEGQPFDPLRVDDPNLSTQIAERQIGGLGIFIAKSVMDELKYVRENNQNILIIKKNI